MKPIKRPRVLQVACVLALVALALFAWSLVYPHPLQVIVAMSVGQVLGTISLVLFLAVVFLDLRDAQQKEKERTALPPPSGGKVREA